MFKFSFRSKAQFISRSQDQSSQNQSAPDRSSQSQSQKNDLSPNQDHELLARLKRGDQLAVQTWFKLYHKKLLRFVLTKVSQPKDAEEIVQETFINCLRHLPLFRGESSVMTWMVGIARHEVADYYRKKYAKKAIKTLPLGELLLEAPVSNAHETSGKVRLVLAEMSAQYCELLQLKYVDRKKIKQIARELGKTVKAVESDLFRARNQFRYLWVRLDD